MNIGLDLSNGFDIGLNKRRISPKKEYVDASSATQPQILIDCPVTGKPAQKLAEISVDIPNGQANWWRCSACGGWHLNLEDKHNGSRKQANNYRIPSFETDLIKAILEETHESHCIHGIRTTGSSSA